MSIKLLTVMAGLLLGAAAPLVSAQAQGQAQNHETREPAATQVATLDGMTFTKIRDNLAWRQSPAVQKRIETLRSRSSLQDTARYFETGHLSRPYAAREEGRRVSHPVD